MNATAARAENNPVENLEKEMLHFWNDTPANWNDTLCIANCHINFWARLSNELATISGKYVAGTFDDIKTLKKVYYLSHALRETWMRH